MSNIVIPVVLVSVMGLVFAIILTIASKVFHVDVDETVVKLRENLPGANCGGCGFAGCDDYAASLAADPENVGPSRCPVGGAEVAAKLAEVLGLKVEEKEKEAAFVRCNGNCNASKDLIEYQGLMSCAAAKQVYGGMNVCKYGCLGLGDCMNACQFGAIKVCNGVAVVNREKCIGCGACTKACPNGLIMLLPESKKVAVQCSSKDKGAVVRKACTNGCIGCGKCEKTCKFDAIHVVDGLAVIDYDKCKSCGMCAKECPVGAINNMRLKRKVEAPLAEEAK